VDEIGRIVRRIRARWPRVRILLRADSGFAREPLMTWCEDHRVDYLFGLARNERLTTEIAAEIEAARVEAEASGKARRFRDFEGLTQPVVAFNVPASVARSAAASSAGTS